MKGLEFLKLADMPRDPNNARLHPPEQLEQIANSIRKFGFTVPGLFDTVVRVGNGRHAACELIYAAGETIYLAPGKDHGGEAIPVGTMPVFNSSGWTEEQKRAYALVDNQLALNSTWDEDRLRAEIEALTAVGFEIPLLGFDEAELTRLFNPPQPGLTDPDALPDEPENPVTRRDDVWCCGPHRIKCGDATCAEDVESVLNGQAPHLMITDPPYGVEYDANWRNEADRANGKPYGASAIGKVSNDERVDWQEAWALFAGSAAYVWHADRHASAVQASLEAVGFEIRSQIIWAKDRLIISRGDYHWMHEPAWYCVRKGKRSNWQGDRKQTTVWAISHQKSETGHSTQKPVECMKRPIENNSAAGDYVYDPFLGSGTSAIAAEMLGRKCLALELNPAYVDVSVARWMQFSGGTAILEATGQTFAEVTAERAAEQVAA